MQQIEHTQHPSTLTFLITSLYMTSRRLTFSGGGSPLDRLMGGHEKCSRQEAWCEINVRAPLPSLESALDGASPEVTDPLGSPVCGRGPP